MVVGWYTFLGDKMSFRLRAAKFLCCESDKLGFRVTVSVRVRVMGIVLLHVI